MNKMGKIDTPLQRPAEPFVFLGECDEGDVVETKSCGIRFEVVRPSHHSVRVKELGDRYVSFRNRELDNEEVEIKLSYSGVRGAAPTTVVKVVG